MIFRLLTIMLAMGAVSCGESPAVSPSRDSGLFPQDSGDLPPDSTVPPGDQRIPSTEPVRGYLYFGIVEKQDNRSLYVPVGVLMDLRGKVIREWQISGLPSRMLPGGSIIGDSRERVYFPFRDAVEMVQIDWDGMALWRFRDWQEVFPDGEAPEDWYDAERSSGLTSLMSSRQHHDFQREGNPVGYYAPGQEAKEKGNTLVLAYYTHNISVLGKQATILDDAIYEVDSAGKRLSFRWFAGDHMDEYGLDQEALEDFAKQKSMNTFMINSMSRLGKNRWFLANGDRRFHPRNILIGSRNANFIAILDHQSGKVVWRLGPDMGAGTPGQKLGQMIGQHHPHMIPFGLPGGGNILVYDNGGQSGYGGPKGFPKHSRNYTRVLEFNPLTLEKVWQYGGPMGDPQYFLSAFSGSSQRLPDGNTLILNGASAAIYLVTPAGKKVWSLALSSLKGHSWHFNLYRVFMIPPEWLPNGLNPSGYTAWKELYYPAR